MDCCTAAVTQPGWQVSNALNSLVLKSLERPSLPAGKCTVQYEHCS